MQLNYSKVLTQNRPFQFNAFFGLYFNFSFELGGKNVVELAIANNAARSALRAVQHSKNTYCQMC